MEIEKVNAPEHEIFVATIRVAYPKGNIAAGPLLNIGGLAMAFETAYGNCEVDWRTEEAPKDPCPDHLYWEKDNCLRCQQKAANNS